MTDVHTASYRQTTIYAGVCHCGTRIKKCVIT